MQKLSPFPRLERLTVLRVLPWDWMSASGEVMTWGMGIKRESKTFQTIQTKRFKRIYEQPVDGVFWMLTFLT